ncbi:MAG: TetR/AcrR family transcriptional regulator, partial [Leifsonia sp.]
MVDLEDALPRGVALTWGVAENPQRGPKRELSIERIVETAVEIADAEGLGAVSMAKVAANLGFTTMSLYRYVTSKDDLLVLMEDAASEMPIPSEDDVLPWRDGVHRWVNAVRAVYREHPWIAKVPIAGAPMTPNSLLAADWLLRELRGLPLDDSEKMSSLL